MNKLVLFISFLVVGGGRLMYEPDVSDACPALLLAVRDALHRAPCRRKFSCWKKKYPRQNLLQTIKDHWQVVPEHLRDATFHRLKVCRFATSFGYESMPWGRFLDYFDNSEMLGVEIREHFALWQQSQKLPPAKTLYLILMGKGTLTLETAAYILELLPGDTKNELGKLLLSELNRVCYATFATPGTSREEFLKLRLEPHDKVEHRPLVVRYQM